MHDVVIQLGCRDGTAAHRPGNADGTDAHRRGNADGTARIRDSERLDSS